MEFLQKILAAVWNFLFFALLSIIFIPAWLIVANLQDIWSKKLDELFS